VRIDSFTNDAWPRAAPAPVLALPSAATGAFEGIRGPAAPEVRGAVRASGFDARSAPPAAVPPGSVARTTFDSPPAVAAPATPRATAPPAARRPVEILDKPRPRYTEEARRRRIEGSVQLEVVFAASGTVVVGAIIRSLGFGLDEAAREAARAIRFRPASEDGRAVDQKAVLHIVFKITE
jgi:TonB family protein